MYHRKILFKLAISVFTLNFQGDERCILDTMRLVDLLLVLLFEGRQALPKGSTGKADLIAFLGFWDISIA
jgi:hypothetical protein